MEALIRNPEVVTLALLSCVLTFLPVFAPAGGLMLSILAPFPLIVLGLKYPWRWMLSVLGFEAVVLGMAEGLPALFVLTYYAVVPLVMAVTIRLGLTMTRTIVWSVVIPTVLSLVGLGLYSLVQNQSPSALLTEYVNQALEGMTGPVNVADSGSESAPETDLNAPVNRSQADGAARAAEILPRLVLTLLPAMLVINYLLTNVVNYSVVYWYCRRSQPPLDIHMESIASWRVSDYLVWVFLASGVILLLPLGMLSHAGLNVFVITLALYLLQGVAIAAFWGQRLPLPPGAKWLLAVVILLFVGPLFLVLCTAAGLFDLWVDFRRQRHQTLVS